MSDRHEVESRIVVEGRPVLVRLIQNPTIEDVLVTEARVFLGDLDHGRTPDTERRVSRDIRDFLIRTGVER